MTEVAGADSPMEPLKVRDAPSCTPMRVLVAATVRFPFQVLSPDRLWIAPRWTAGVGVVAVFWPVPEMVRVWVSL